MMVSDVESRMSYREFLGWARFYNEQTSQMPRTATTGKRGSQVLDPNAPETEALFRCWAKNLPKREGVGKLNDGHG